MRASVRIGAALAPRHGRNACRLLQRAEEAFEQAAGEANRYALYTPGQAQSEAQRREAAIADEIISALNQRRIVLAYQPVVATKGGETAFVEALLRVRQDDGGLVGPEVCFRSRKNSAWSRSSITACSNWRSTASPPNPH